MAASSSPQLCADAAAYPVESDGASKTLKYHLLGPSLTKAGQEKVDQSKVGLRLRPLPVPHFIHTLIPTGDAGIRNYLQCLQRLKIL